MECVILDGGGIKCSEIEDRLLLDGHPLRTIERLRVESFRKFNASQELERIAGSFPSAQDVGYINADVPAVCGNLG